MSCDLLEASGLPPCGLRQTTVPAKRPAGRAERPGLGRHWLIQKNKNRTVMGRLCLLHNTPLPRHTNTQSREKRTYYNAKKNLFGLHVETRVLQDKDLKCYITTAASYSLYSDLCDMRCTYCPTVATTQTACSVRAFKAEVEPRQRRHRIILIVDGATNL